MRRPSQLGMPSAELVTPDGRTIATYRRDAASEASETRLEFESDGVLQRTTILSRK
jgi:hypothetical protein